MISIIIPVYKNQAEFFSNLKNNLKYLKNEQIIIINDCPGENLAPTLKKLCPKATLLNNSLNLGFGPSVNKGAKYAKAEILLLLNSDVKLFDNNYQKALTLFKDPKVFAVTLAQSEKNGQITGANTGNFKRGLFHHYGRVSRKVSKNLWPEGGSSLIRRSYFEKLNGFDPDYAPFYWEDVDLGYRAQKMGWKTLFYPFTNIKHHHQTTIGRYFSKSKIKTIAYRNQFLFVWKNIKGWSLCQHLCWLPLILWQNRKNKAFLSGFTQAFKKQFAN